MDRRAAAAARKAPEPDAKKATYTYRPSLGSTPKRPSATSTLTQQTAATAARRTGTPTGARTATPTAASTGSTARSARPQSNASGVAGSSSSTVKTTPPKKLASTPSTAAAPKPLAGAPKLAAASARPASASSRSTTTATTATTNPSATAPRPPSNAKASTVKGHAKTPSALTSPRSPINETIPEEGPLFAAALVRLPRDAAAGAAPDDVQSIASTDILRGAARRPSPRKIEIRNPRSYAASDAELEMRPKAEPHHARAGSMQSERPSTAMNRDISAAERVREMELLRTLLQETDSRQKLQARLNDLETELESWKSDGTRTEHPPGAARTVYERGRHEKLKAEINMLNARIDTMESDREKFIEREASDEAIKMELRKEVEHLKSEVDRVRKAKAKGDDREADSAAIKRELQAKVDLLRTQKGELERVQSQATTDRNDLTKLRERLESVQGLLVEKDARIDRMQEDAELLKKAQSKEAEAAEGVLEGQLDALQISLSRREEEIDQMRKALDDFKTSGTAKDAAYAKLKGDLDHLKTIQDEAGRQAEVELQNKVDELTSVIAAAEKAREHSQKQVDELKEFQQAELETARQSANAEFERLQITLSEAETRADELRQRVLDLESTVSESQAARDSSDRLLQAMQADDKSDDLRSEIEQLRTEIEDAREATDRAKIGEEDLQQELQALKLSLSDKKSVDDALQIELDRLRTLEGTGKASEEKIEDLKRQIEHLSQLIESKDEANDGIIHELEQTLRQGEQELSKLQTSLVDSVAAGQTLTEEIERLRLVDTENTNVADAKIEELQRRHADTLEEERASHEAVAEEKDAAISALQEEVAKLNARADELEQLHADTVRRGSEYQSALVEKDVIHDGLREEIKSLTSEVEAKHREHDRLQDLLDAASADNSALQGLKTELESVRASSAAALEQHGEVVHDLEGRLARELEQVDTHKSAAADLSRQLETQRATVSSLVDELETMRQSHNNVKALSEEQLALVEVLTQRIAQSQDAHDAAVSQFTDLQKKDQDLRAQLQSMHDLRESERSKHTALTETSERSVVSLKNQLQNLEQEHAEAMRQKDRHVGMVEEAFREAKERAERAQLLLIEREESAAEIPRMRETIQALKRESAAAEQEAVARNRENSELSSVVDDLQSKIRELQVAAERTQQRSEKEASGFSAIVEGLQRELQTTQQKLAHNQYQNLKSEEALIELQRSRQAEDDASRLLHDLEELRDELHGVRSKAGMETEARHQAEHRLTQAGRDIDSLQSSLEQTQIQLSIAKKDQLVKEELLVELQERHAEQQRLSRDAEKIVEGLQQEIIELQRCRSQAEDSRAHAEQQLQGLEKRYAMESTASEPAKETIEALQNDLVMLRETLSLTQAEHAQARRQLRELRKSSARQSLLGEESLSAYSNDDSDYSDNGMTLEGTLESIRIQTEQLMELNDDFLAEHERWNELSGLKRSTRTSAAVVLAS